jgi:hypothetical protein
MTRRSSKVKISFQKVDPKARKHRETVVRSRSDGKPVVRERELVDLWMEKKPTGITFIDWWRAWNNGYPDDVAVELYNELHPDEDEQIALVDDALVDNDADD